MKKAEIIARYGEEEYKRRLKSRRKEALIARGCDEVYKKQLELCRKRNKKEEFIARNGEKAWRRKLEKIREWKKAHPEQQWYKKHPEKVKARRKECRKGGKYYEKKLVAQRTGLRGERNRIRKRDEYEFCEIRDTLAEEVHLHHEWIYDTAEYRGVAFVEKKAHQHGLINVVLLLDGEITISDFT